MISGLDGAIHGDSRTEDLLVGGGLIRQEHVDERPRWHTVVAP